MVVAVVIMRHRWRRKNKEVALRGTRHRRADVRGNKTQSCQARKQAAWPFIHVLRYYINSAILPIGDSSLEVLNGGRNILLVLWMSTSDIRASRRWFCWLLAISRL